VYCTELEQKKLTIPPCLWLILLLK
jgi:hypothetical protein